MSLIFYKIAKDVYRFMSGTKDIVNAPQSEKEMSFSTEKNLFQNTFYKT